MCFVLGLAVVAAHAVTVAELQKAQASGEKLTVIDVRSPAAYGQGHIPGAINVPASLCAQKKLPPLGKVIVCGDGLAHETTDTAAAVTALGAKAGITAEVLEGGYAAWESARGLTTRGKGTHVEERNYISYAQLKAVNAAEVVLVDLRKAPEQQAAGTNQPLSDLAQEFPGMPVTRSAFESLPTKQAVAGSTAPPLLVLIDNADGTAENMARTLRANGVRRVVILAGGEAIIARKGQAGLQRSSPPARGFNKATTAATGK